MDIAIDAVDQLLGSGEWQLNVQTFIDNNCLVFVDDGSGDGHHHGQFDVFREWVGLKENIVGGALSALGCTEEQFAEAVEVRIKGGDSQAVKLLDTLFYLDDFEAFARMMARRNKELLQHGPLGPAPTRTPGTGGPSASAGASVGLSADMGKEAGLPMFMWDKEWDVMLALAQGIVKGNKTATDGASRDTALNAWAETMCEMEAQRVAGTDPASQYVLNLEAALRDQRLKADEQIKARLSGAPAPGSAPAPAPAPVFASTPATARTGGVTERKATMGDGGAPAVVPPLDMGAPKEIQILEDQTAAALQQLQEEREARESRERELADLQRKLQDMEQSKAQEGGADAASDGETTRSESDSSSDGDRRGKKKKKKKKKGKMGKRSGGRVTRTIALGVEALTAEEEAERHRRREWIMSRGLGEKGAGDAAPAPVPAPAPAPAPGEEGWVYRHADGSEEAAAAPAPAPAPAADYWQEAAFGGEPSYDATYTSGDAYAGGGGAYDQSGAYYPPAAAPAPAAAWQANPAEWTRCFDSSQGHYFWVNNTTGESMWEEQPADEP